MPRPEGYVRVFIDEGATGTITARLEAGLLEGPAADHARRVLATTDAPAPTRTRAGRTAEQPRARGDAPPWQRSQRTRHRAELLVSLNTFRTHTKNIYAKLGVSTRREAIRRASELGL